MTTTATVYVRFKIDAEQQDAYTIVDDLCDTGTFSDAINEYAKDNGYPPAVDDGKEWAKVTSVLVDDLSRAREFVREVVLALGGNDGDAATLEASLFDGEAEDFRVSSEEVLRRVRAYSEKASAAEAHEEDRRAGVNYPHARRFVRDVVIALGGDSDGGDALEAACFGFSGPDGSVIERVASAAQAERDLARMKEDAATAKACAEDECVKPVESEPEYVVGSFWVFNTEYDVEEQSYNGQRCMIVSFIPDNSGEGDNDCLVKFDNGHHYEAYFSEVQKPWREPAK